MDIHYFAAARAARGLAHERITTTAATLAELVDELGRLPGAGTTDSLLLQFLRGGLGLGCRLLCGLCRGLFLGGFNSLGLGDLLGCRLGGDGFGLFCGGVFARQGGTAGQGHRRFAGAACNLNRLVNPIGDGCEHLGVQRVEATLPLHRHGDDVCIAEDFKVL